MKPVSELKQQMERAQVLMDKAISKAQFNRYNRLAHIERTLFIQLIERDCPCSELPGVSSSH